MKKRGLALLLALALVFSLAACGGKGTGAKTFTVSVTHADGSTKEFTVSTDKETVGEALEDEGLIAGEVSTYGLYVQTVDGETADEAAEQWWCMTKNGGETVNTGADSTPVEDGAAYEWTLMTGY